jgi:hypothetical protein
MKLTKRDRYIITELAGKTDEELHDLAHHLTFGQFNKKAYTMEDHGRWGRMQGSLIIWQDRSFNLVHSKDHPTAMPLYVECAKCGKAYNANQSMWQIRHYHNHLFNKD